MSTCVWVVCVGVSERRARKHVALPPPHTSPCKSPPPGCGSPAHLELPEEALAADGPVAGDLGPREHAARVVPGFGRVKNDLWGGGQEGWRGVRLSVRVRSLGTLVTIKQYRCSIEGVLYLEQGDTTPPPHPIKTPSPQVLVGRRPAMIPLLQHDMPTPHPKT